MIFSLPFFSYPLIAASESTAANLPEATKLFQLGGITFWFLIVNISSLQLSNLMIKIIKDNEKLIYMKNKLSIEKKSLDWEKILKNHPLFC